MVLFHVSILMVVLKIEKLILPVGTGVPALSTNKVSAAPPSHAVATSIAVGVGDLGASISPPGVVAAVVCAGRGWGALASDKVSRRAGSQISCGSSEGAGGGHSGSDERAEGNHIEYRWPVKVYFEKRTENVDGGEDLLKDDTECLYRSRDSAPRDRDKSGQAGLVRGDGNIVAEY